MPRQWTWVRTGIPPKCKLPPDQKREYQARADRFVSEFYRPMFVQPPPKRPHGNYVVDFSTKWHGAYLLFLAKYACPGPNVLSPFFEHAFARLGYFRPDAWSLWARCSNDEWIVIEYQLPLAKCFAEMRENTWFHC